MKKHIQYRRWIIWGLATAFYFYEYFLRVAPSVMVKELYVSFNIGAGMLGVITAAYLYAYAPMQIPVGMLMDRFGARKLLTLASFVCGIASILFGIAMHVPLSIIARLLMGAGSAFAFIGMIYISSHWFHGGILALLVGIGNSIGMLGAVFGEGPLAELIDYFSWRSTSVVLGIIGLALGFIIYLAVRNEPRGMKRHDPAPTTSFWESFKKVCKNRQTWINAIVGMMFYTATVGYGGLWAIPFLKRVYHFSNEEASFAASMVYMGTIVAGPIIGYISDKICNRKNILLIFTLLSLFFFCIVTYSNITSHFWIFFYIFMLGVCLSAQLLNYSLAIELNTPKTKGTALAITNSMVFIAGSLIQTLVGYLLSFNWKGEMIGDVPIYSPHNYKIALACFPITMLIAFIFTFFIKEKDKPWCKHDIRTPSNP